MTPEQLGLPAAPRGRVYRETWRAAGPVRTPYGERDAATAILFLRETVVVGPDPEDLQRLVPAGEWQAARPAGDEPVLVACLVAPGFDFADFELES